MVPSPDAAAWSISSNELYAQSVEKVFNETSDKDGAGHDYSFLSTVFPTQWKASDLKEQIDKFLAMPKPRTTPTSTLWVFSFGMWDIWTLSALPIGTGKEAVRGMTKDMFEQIERLRAASMDSTSIAFSDVHAVVPSSPADQNTTSEAIESVEEDAAGQKFEKREEAEAQAETATEVTVELSETFQILIPRIMDPSMLPGWRDLRPETPSVHSKAEQMRNAAALTSTWNDGIVDQLANWVKKDQADSTDPAAEAEGAQGGGSSDFYFDKVSPSTDRPRRDGFAYNLADYVLDQMLERQMRNARQKDGEGRGSGAVEEGYRDVQKSCLASVADAVVASTAQSDVHLTIPNLKIDHDKQVPSKAAVKRRGEGENQQTERQAEASAAKGPDGRKEAVAYLSTAKVCEIPSDHLFFTPFALGQRAIREIAAEAAEMIQKGESVRAKLGA